MTDDPWVTLRQAVRLLHDRASENAGRCRDVQQDASIPLAVAGAYRYVFRLIEKLAPQPPAPTYTPAQSRLSPLPEKTREAPAPAGESPEEALPF